MEKHIGVIGGDQRNLILAKSLADKGFDVLLWATDKSKAFNSPNINFAKSLDEIIEKSKVLIGPIPFTQDGKYIFAPLSQQSVEIQSLIERLSGKEIVLVASVIPEDIKSFCREKNVKFFDLYEKEELAILNAIPTVEGCLMIAIEKMPITLHSSNILILGYGRIGKVLAKVLKGFEANIYVASRKSSDLTWCKALGFLPVRLCDIAEYVNKMDLIVNTIPAMVVTKEVIDRIRDDTLVIDLASKPGGVDFEYARKKGIEVVHALSLPGKVAPVTAAKYISEVLLSLLEEIWG
ncbi:D-isomer specific 2-hydroxyacid dehydrogenase NAD-binding protein [Caldicellulosiruptor acetigenus I77R1B]|uniref:D-isomer specific 2-hydroxyacid dehydrogenase NAD-binding protein n=1 Tax=Caldicellulosiruptor acetigenus (strain ATCC 700853 / DSM 12137 / I77R1B) TaxID=632335 RepID=E4S524_CALA7|nr:dipicolinate synthase subunit DpsA [Caldicellulosiruptor acetigenus]ADQ40478.1 D-isomer specific 2-hydroxyacid dehydrogenase NAD-binding protein [Caldicellulosiruptor acetigenus I77R1B]